MHYTKKTTLAILLIVLGTTAIVWNSETTGITGAQVTSTQLIHNVQIVRTSLGAGRFLISCNPTTLTITTGQTISFFNTAPLMVCLQSSIFGTQCVASGARFTLQASPTKSFTVKCGNRDLIVTVRRPAPQPAAPIPLQPAPAPTPVPSAPQPATPKPAAPAPAQPSPTTPPTNVTTQQAQQQSIQALQQLVQTLQQAIQTLTTKLTSLETRIITLEQKTTTTAAPLPAPTPALVTPTPAPAIQLISPAGTQENPLHVNYLIKDFTPTPCTANAQITCGNNVHFILDDLNKPNTANPIVLHTTLPTIITNLQQNFGLTETLQRLQSNTGLLLDDTSGIKLFKRTTPDSYTLPTLPPGDYTLTAILTNNNKPLTPSVEQTVKFTVPTPPKPIEKVVERIIERTEKIPPRPAYTFVINVENTLTKRFGTAEENTATVGDAVKIRNQRNDMLKIITTQTREPILIRPFQESPEIQLDKPGLATFVFPQLDTTFTLNAAPKACTENTECAIHESCLPTGPACKKGCIDTRAGTPCNDQCGTPANNYCSSELCIQGTCDGAKCQGGTTLNTCSGENLCTRHTNGVLTLTKDTTCAATLEIVPPSRSFHPQAPYIVLRKTGTLHVFNRELTFTATITTLPGSAHTFEQKIIQGQGTSFTADKPGKTTLGLKDRPAKCPENPQVCGTLLVMDA